MVRNYVALFAAMCTLPLLLDSPQKGDSDLSRIILHTSTPLTSICLV
jgi:hypothetical protein